MTIVVPTAKAAGASLVIVSTPQLSNAVGVPSTTPAAEHIRLSAETVWSSVPGACVTVGTSSSVTMTTRSKVSALPLTSVTMKLTTVVPAG